MRARNGLFLAVTILWTGCQESELSDDDSAFLDDDDAMEPGGQIDADSILDFGDVYVGESSELTVEIRNTGVQPLLVSAALLAGGSEDFSIVFESEVSIVAETSIYLPLEVTFAPSEAKAHSSSLILLTSAFNVEPTAPFAVELSGNGLQDDDGDGHPWGEDYHGPDADCDDANGDVHPQAEELCDGIDNNCDGGVDNRADEDGDGATLCDDYPDCDDTDGMVHPAWVDPDAVGGLGTRAQPFSSMIDALESENCGQVLLTSGVYYEGEVVEIESGPLEVVSVDGHLAAEVSGGGNTPLFSVAGGPATFIDVLFQDGYASNSAGAVHATAAVAFEGCSFAYNRSDTGAGAVRVDDADLVVDGCQFLMNEGTNGGAVAAWSSDDQTVEHISIRETDFVGNAAQYGGGVYLQHSSVGHPRFPLHSSMFPEICQYVTRVASNRVTVVPSRAAGAGQPGGDRLPNFEMAAHPILGSHQVGETLIHMYYDHMALGVEGREGVPVLVDAKTKAPVVVVGQVGRGRVVFDGTIALASPRTEAGKKLAMQLGKDPKEDNFEHPAFGLSRELLVNGARWTCGLAAPVE